MAPRYRVIICRGPECGERRGSEALREVFAAEAVRLELADRVDLEWQSCFGRCSQGPNVLVRAEVARGHMVTVAAAPIGARANAALYSAVVERDVPRILAEHVGNGRIVTELVIRPGTTGKPEGGRAR